MKNHDFNRKKENLLNFEEKITFLKISTILPYNLCNWGKVILPCRSMVKSSTKNKAKNIVQYLFSYKTEFSWIFFIWKADRTFAYDLESADITIYISLPQMLIFRNSSVLWSESRHFLLFTNCQMWNLLKKL